MAYEITSRAGAILTLHADLSEALDAWARTTEGALRSLDDGHVLAVKSPDHNRVRLWRQRAEKENR